MNITRMGLSNINHGRLFYDPPCTELERKIEAVLCSSTSGGDDDPSYSGFDDEEEWV